MANVRYSNSHRQSTAELPLFRLGCVDDVSFPLLFRSLHWIKSHRRGSHCRAWKSFHQRACRRASEACCSSSKPSLSGKRSAKWIRAGESFLLPHVLHGQRQCWSAFHDSDEAPPGLRIHESRSMYCRAKPQAHTQSRGRRFALEPLSVNPTAAGGTCTRALPNVIVASHGEAISSSASPSRVTMPRYRTLNAPSPFESISTQLQFTLGFECNRWFIPFRIDGLDKLRKPALTVCSTVDCFICATLVACHQVAENPVKSKIDAAKAANGILAANRWIVLSRSFHPSTAMNSNPNPSLIAGPRQASHVVAIDYEHEDRSATYFRSRVCSDSVRVPSDHFVR